MSWSKARRRRHRVLKQIYLQAQVWKCAYCGRRLTYKTATYDHVVPRSRGGRNELANKVLVCEPCNVEKADCLPSAFEIAAAKRIFEIVETLAVNRFGRNWFMSMEARQKKEINQVRRVFDPRHTTHIDAGNGVIVEIVKRTRKGKRFVVVVTSPAEQPAVRLTLPPESA